MYNNEQKCKGYDADKLKKRNTSCKVFPLSEKVKCFQLIAKAKKEKVLIEFLS